MRIRLRILKTFDGLFIDNSKGVVEKKVIREVQTFEKRKDSFTELPLLVKELASEAKHPMLEIGCGNGGLLHGLCNVSSANLYGLEIDKSRARNARSNVSKCSALVLLANGESLPFKSSSFQVIFSIEVIEHVLNYKKFLLEIDRVLMPDGYVFITFPSFRSIKGPHLFHILPIPWAQFIFGYDVQKEYVLNRLQTVFSNVNKLDYLNHINIHSFLKAIYGTFDIVLLRVYTSFKIFKLLQFIPIVDDYVGDSVRVLMKKTGMNSRRIQFQYLNNKKSQAVEAFYAKLSQMGMFRS